MDDYSGSFDPSFDLGKLSRSALASLAREYMIFEWLRGGASVAMQVGPEVMPQISIDEWMGASPI